MPSKTPDKKQSSNGCPSYSQSSRRRRKDLNIDNHSNLPGSVNHITEKNSNKTSKEDPGTLILKLLHNGRRSVVTSDVSLTGNSFRSQSRTKHCGSVIPLVETSDKKSDNISDQRVSESNATLFTTPPPNRKGRYSVFSTCGTNNQKCTNYSNGGNEKSLTSSSSSNPTNFALPMYMRSPNPENVPMPCGFPIEG
ncbi:hypothetical protein FG386_002923 [Cryptosporidium ryanae]|uniref:uncharacterized protein n=1 Tax=Cryptosporidium ryanae TaxID=515981 RepID=UPI00351A1CFA|nr:hypothetical protein FG386_002923 [Cryptosporidium ryanae]